MELTVSVQGSSPCGGGVNGTIQDPLEGAFHTVAATHTEETHFSRCDVSLLQKEMTATLTTDDVCMMDGKLFGWMFSELWG